MDDVINNVREAFLDEGVDEQVLQELKQVSFQGFSVPILYIVLTVCSPRRVRLTRSMGIL